MNLSKHQREYLESCARANQTHTAYAAALACDDALRQTRVALREYMDAIDSEPDGFGSAQRIAAANASGRCYCCGWPLKTQIEEGCVIGNCSFRPNRGAYDYDGWRRRSHEALVYHANDGKASRQDADAPVERDEVANWPVPLNSAQRKVLRAALWKSTTAAEAVQPSTPDAATAARPSASTAQPDRAPVAATEATAREDAARYRFLRDMFTWEDCAFGDGEVKWVIYLKMRPPIEEHEWKAEPATWRVRERFDAAIDAARAASTGGSNAAIATADTEQSKE